jgi:hypothetical protein
MLVINSGHHYLLIYQIDIWVDNDVPNWFSTLNNFYRSPFSKLPPQYLKNSTFSYIIKICIIYPHIKFWWYRTMLNFCDIVVVILKMATSRNCSMSGLNSAHHYLPTYQIVISTGRHFQNDRHNIAKIQHCPISSKFDMWVNFDDIGQCWIFAILWRSFWKWQPVEIVQCRDSIRDIIMSRIDSRHWTISTGHHFQNGHHNTAKIQHCPILSMKMATGRNLSMSEINSGHHNLPTYEMALKSDNVEFEWYCGGHLKFQLFASFKMYHKNSTLSDIITIWYVGR